MDALPQLSDDDIARLVYLGVLGVALIGYALVATQGRLLTFLRHAILWALIFVGAAAAYGLWDSTQFSRSAVQTAEGDGMVLRRGFDGQYHVTLDITGPNGVPTPVRFILDTGATDMVLTQEDAAKLGFAEDDLRYLGLASTANGMTRTAQVTLDRVALEGHVASGVRALVNEGALHASLLGMRYLERFSRIEIMRDRLRITF
ncbi:retropepsin-like aspartic protease family protein [Pararhodobacter marinus]|uniref:TIGR02281 family clan AA aspartic protease n=1 Tax=Pararhodobacter marinus TaxID=2184063 RepID=A0A2U2CAV4_9RHOB|nr:TIGR02281 family clan AA aspartic protease [Pararhodobacter marinus]PWE29026.1 TIGR02281 family clan AA aspartic protease [Pararhodobacter marinus]